MKPNIIIVMTDQQRADLRKKMGYELDTMPFLDSWAKDAADFEKAYTPNPSCMPARVSMFTGRYPESHRVRSNYNEDDALYTKDLLDVLKKEGYITALCGKNHSHRNLEDFDFCRSYGHLTNEGGKDLLPLTDDDKAFEQFMRKTKFLHSEAPSPCSIEQQYPYKNISSLFDFIDANNEEKPFFAWVSIAEPHNPYQVPKPYFDMFAPEDLPKINSTIEGKGERFEWIYNIWEQVLGAEKEDKILRMRSNYHGMLRLIDDQFKRMINGLDERNLTDNTFVIFMSDHGDFVGEYGLTRKGPDLPEVLTRIPFVMKGYGVEKNIDTSNYCANIVDILPTICDLLKIEIPYGCQGKSLLPLLQKKADVSNEFEFGYSESGYGGQFWNKDDMLDIYTEGCCQKPLTGHNCLNSWTQCGSVRMIRKGDYKMQIDMMGNGYLYDLSEDRTEVNNLWDNENCVGIKAELLSELTKIMLKNTDIIPAPHDRLRVKTHEKNYWNTNFKAPDKGDKQSGTILEIMLKHKN